MAVIHFNDESFETLLGTEGLALVDFWAEWCTPCKMLGPTIEALDEQYTGKVTIGKVDIDACPAIAQKFGVMSIPTVLLFKDGKEIDRKVGLLPASAFQQALDANL